MTTVDTTALKTKDPPMMSIPKISLTVAFAGSLLAATFFATGCDSKTDSADTKKEVSGDTKTDAHAEFKKLTVEEVEKLKADGSCVPVDANGDSTRNEYGVVPDAVLLSSFNEYKVSELPADKASKLVFYCGSEQCSAAPKAAKVAMEAGYTDVNVMPAGIRGWVKAGKDVKKPKS